ncbi:unnamed protein product [Euphydryas editha]|uniref:Androgen-induced gene 1 protein-like n=1 Tax=Euphydryas editha TaxID=104508 RepID=A0AAU9V495_EUPED|nr:unnamed protein product [Euphydryas editha]
MLRPLFHLTVVAINSFVLWYDQTYIKLPMPAKGMENLPLKSRSMFLTFWCLMLQTVYHFVALLNDLFGTNTRMPKKAPIIRRIKDTLFTLAFVAAIYVSLAFWSIYFIDKELIFPDHIEKLYHPSINHVMHTTVAVFIIIDMLMTHINYPSRKIGFTVTMTFFISYIIWFFYIYAKTGAWVYPVFDPLNWPLRIIFVSISLTLGAIFYFAGEKLNYVINSNNKDTRGKGAKNGIANEKKKT